MDIALDVDGPLASLHTEWYRRYNRDFNDNLSLDRVTSWDTHLYVKPECGKGIYKYLHDADLYEHVPVMEGAQWGVQRLRELGHNVMFVTSCVTGMADQKAAWLVRHGFTRGETRPGFLPIDMIVATDKKWIAADLLIDDAAHTIKEWVMSRRRAILFDFPHNQNLDMPSMHWSWCKRAETWQKVIALIEGA